MFSLENKTAIVTGGGSGIGRAISKMFAQQGAIVYILDLDEKGAKETIDEITAKNGKAFFEKCNVSVQQEVKNIIYKISAIDIVVNNAGIAHVGNVENTTESDFERLFSVNVKGVYNVLNAVVPMMKNKGGVILNLASIAS